MPTLLESRRTLRDLCNNYSAWIAACPSAAQLQPRRSSGVDTPAALSGAAHGGGSVPGRAGTCLTLEAPDYARRS